MVFGRNSGSVSGGACVGMCWTGLAFGTGEVRDGIGEVAISLLQGEVSVCVEMEMVAFVASFLPVWGLLGLFGVRLLRDWGGVKGCGRRVRKVFTK